LIIYEATKAEFVDSVLNDRIDVEISESYQARIGKPNPKEFSAWSDSMQYMFKVLCTQDIPDDAGVAIEYRIPSTSKRVDFLISGIDDSNQSVVIVIELKRWAIVEKVEGKDGIVKTRLGPGRLHETTHPSYQAWTYQNLIEDFNSTVQEDSIPIIPCAYLHNMDRDTNPDLEDPIYQIYIDRAPVYTKGEVLKLRDFIKRFVKLGDSRDILYRIEHGRLVPSKSLQDHLLSLLRGNPEFLMIDEQKVVYEEAFQMALASKRDNRKRVLIVEGGPGTGKSVLAINLLVNLTNKECVAHYVSKNSAPRNVYSTKLRGSFTRNHIDNLFKGSGSYHSCEENTFDALIVDEAHRLNEKSGMFKNYGENQIMEVIRSSRFSVFFIDENQRIHIDDIGETRTIKDFARKMNASCTTMKLMSQFRCNGSDGFLAWVDDVLEIRPTANDLGFGDEYDFRVFDDPSKMRDEIFRLNERSNKARLLAGYCWNWIREGKSNPDIHDIEIPPFDFSMSWNLGNTSTWAIDPESVNEVGCIHTSQGLEFDYIGVIIGPDMVYRDGHIQTDFTKRARTDQSLKGIKKINRERPEDAKRIADEIIKNTYRTLLTRGQKGCYVYCTDEALREYLKKRINKAY